MGKNLIIISIFIFLLFSVSCNKSKQRAYIPKAQKGILDLRNWDFEKNGTLFLDGDWEFYWKKLYTPGDFLSKTDEGTRFYRVPGFWNGLVIDKEKIKGEGYATFRLKILHTGTESLDIFIDEQMTAYTFWCNSEKIYNCGQVSNNFKEAVPKEYPTIQTIKLEGDTTELVFQISNFHHRVGGFFKSPKIGLKEDVYTQRISDIAFDLFLFGSILMMSFYHFGIFFMRKEKSAALFFGLFTLVLAIRTLFTGSQYITVLLPDMDWALKYRIEYLTLFFAPLLIVSFLYKIYKKDISRRVTQIFVLISVLYSFTVLLSPTIFSRLLLPFQLFILAGIVYYFARLVKTVIRKRHGARILFTSMLVFFFTIINDILFTRGIITNSIELVPFGTFIFILGQSLVLAKIFTGAFYENEALTLELDYQNKHLERLVEERTLEIDNQRKDIVEKNEELKLQNEEIQAINENLEDQKQRLVISEAKIRGLVELLPEAIFELDWEGKVIYANDEFYRKLGYDAKQDTENIEIDQLIAKKKEDSAILFIEKIKKLLDNNELIKELELKLIKKDKSEFPVLLSLSLVPENQSTAFRCVFIDITQRVENERKIKAALKEIWKKNKDITDSIQYALNIQKAVMPSGDLISSIFSDYFIINKPHSIVGGDFYYFEKKENKVVIALGDCTGHGVPGGFMTMLGITLLNEIYGGEDLLAPNKALDLMRKQIIESLGQSMHEFGSKDGIEMFLGVLDTDTLLLEYASANQPLYIMRNGSLITQKGDKMPLSIYRRMDNFSYHQMQLQKGDIIYLFTDGVIDLFGGTKVRRLYAGGLQEILYECYTKELAEQRVIIEERLSHWQGDNKQTDDMLMIGLRV